jgi:uncharacterized protein involved in outer membrane biogenesis
MSFIARHRWLTGSGVVLALIVVAALLFQWDWLIPIVDSQASAALGRPVTITHLHVALGRVTRIEADGITIDNPKDWPGGGTFATANALAVSIQPLDYIQHRTIVILDITVDTPNIDAQQVADGRANWTLGGNQPASPNPNPAPGPTIGTLHINDGHVHVRDAKLRADFNIAIATKDDQAGASQITADARGTYAAQPITAQFIGGALLSLQDATKPYPVDLHVANGPTRVALTGTIKDPLAFQGADLKLEFAGPDMSLLLPLTGVAIPKTPPYRVAGHLDYGNGVVKFDDFTGKVGSSDLAGNIDVDTKPTRPLIDATLSSRLVDLKDLGGASATAPPASRAAATPWKTCAPTSTSSMATSSSTPSASASATATSAPTSPSPKHPRASTPRPTSTSAASTSTACSPAPASGTAPAPSAARPSSTAPAAPSPASSASPTAR